MKRPASQPALGEQAAAGHAGTRPCQPPDGTPCAGLRRIYFAGAIRAGREDADLYARLIRALQGFGTVLTAHVGDEALLAQEAGLSEAEIFRRDMAWLHSAHLMVAEVSTPSLGVGFEIAMAQGLGLPIHCLYRAAAGRPLSAMIAGNPGLHLHPYTDPEEALRLVCRLGSALPD